MGTKRQGDETARERNDRGRNGKGMKRQGDETTSYDYYGVNNMNKLSLVGMQLREKYKENFEPFALG